MADLVNPKLLILAPGETRDLFIDFGAYAEIVEDGVTLTGTPTTTISPTGPTLGTPEISGTKVVVAVAVGTLQAEGSFKIRFRVEHTGGGYLSRNLKFDVKDV